MTRFLLIAAFVLSAPVVAAQSPSTETQRETAQEVLVMSVVREGDRYVYDVYGYGEDEAVLYRAGAFVVRSESRQRVMVVLEPDGSIPASRDSNALFLSPTHPIDQFIPPEDYLYDIAAVDVTRHPVHVFLCTDDSDEPFSRIEPGSVCRSWTEVGPRSGGDGLDLVIVFGPEQGGNHNRPGDDG